MSSSARIVARGRDSVGLEVVLEAKQMGHIERRHPEMAGLELAIMTAIERADNVQEGSYRGAKVVSTQGLGPSKWLTVVVDYGGNPARVITAYGQAKLRSE